MAENSQQFDDTIADFGRALIKYCVDPVIIQEWAELNKQIQQTEYDIQLYDIGEKLADKAHSDCYFDCDKMTLCPMCMTSKCPGTDILKSPEYCLMDDKTALAEKKATAEKRLIELQKQERVVLNSAFEQLIERTKKMSLFDKIKARWTENYKLFQDAVCNFEAEMFKRDMYSDIEAKRCFDIRCLNVEIVYHINKQKICPHCKNKCEHVSQLQDFAKGRAESYKQARNLVIKSFWNLVLFRKANIK